jgi:hypothetical protein
MSKDKNQGMTKVEAARALRAAGLDDAQIQQILTARGGPKGADIDRGAIYYLAKNPNNANKPELFLTYSKVAWQMDRQEPYNAAMCITAMARDEHTRVVEAKDAVGAKTIKTADIGEPILTLAEANAILLKACEEKIKARKAAEKK